MASRLFHESSLLLFFLLFSLVSMNFDLIIRVWLILIRGCGFQWATDNIPIKNILDPPLHVVLAGWPNAGLIIWCAALLCNVYINILLLCQWKTEYGYY